MLQPEQKPVPLSHQCPSLCLSTFPLSLCVPAILHSVCPPDLHPSVCPPDIQPSVYPSTLHLSCVTPSICLLSLYPSIIISQSMHQTSIFPSICHLPPCNPYLSIYLSITSRFYPSIYLSSFSLSTFTTICLSISLVSGETMNNSQPTGKQGLQDQQ